MLWWRMARRCTGCRRLRQCPGNQWLQIAMIRMNHKGMKMDAEDYNDARAWEM